MEYQSQYSAILYRLSREGSARNPDATAEACNEIVQDYENCYAKTPEYRNDSPQLHRYLAERQVWRDLWGDSEPTFPGIRPASVVAQNPQYPQRSIQGLMGYRPQLNGSHRVEPIRQHAQSPPEFPYRFAQEQRQPQNYGAFPTPSPQSQYARPNHLPPTGPRAELSQPGPVPVKKWQRSPPKPEISQFRTVSGPRPIVVAQMPKQEPLAVKANAQQHIPTGNDDSGIAAPQFIGQIARQQYQEIMDFFKATPRRGPCFAPRLGWNLTTGCPNFSILVRNPRAYPAICGPQGNNINELSHEWGNIFHIIFERFHSPPFPQKHKHLWFTLAWLEFRSDEWADHSHALALITEAHKFMQNWGESRVKQTRDVSGEMQPIDEAWHHWYIEDPVICEIFQQAKSAVEKQAEVRTESGKRGYGGNGQSGRDAKRRG